MRKTALVLVTAAAFVVSFGAVVLAQAKPGSASVQGVWKVAEIAVTGGPNAGTVAQPQPGFFVFTRSHYSVVRINGSGPRPKFTIKDLAKPTDAEKLAAYAQWDRLTAQSGTYQVAGATLTTRPIVAKNEAAMAGPPQTYQFKL